MIHVNLLGENNLKWLNRRINLFASKRAFKVYCFFPGSCKSQDGKIQ